MKLKKHEHEIYIQIKKELGEFESYINVLDRVAKFPEDFEDKDFETFDFTFNKGNKKSYKKIIEFINEVSYSSKKGLFLSGTPGVGKTHLIIAAQKSAIKKGVPNYYVKFPTLCHEIRAQFNDEMSGFKIRSVCQKIKHLSIHDLGVGGMTDFVSGYFFDLIDHRMDSNLLTHFTTNCTVDELRKSLGDRIMDRLKVMCDAYTLTGKSYREKM